jgi:hypothetical protein
LVVFGQTDRFAIECELTDTTVPYFFGKVRVWFGGLSLGDFSGEIISTQMFAAERLLLMGSREPAPAELAVCPGEQCIAELKDSHDLAPGTMCRWDRFDFSTIFPYFGRTLCLLLPLDGGRHRLILGLERERVHEVWLAPGELAEVCLGFSDWVQSQPGYGAGSFLNEPCLCTSGKKYKNCCGKVGGRV